MTEAHSWPPGSSQMAMSVRAFNWGATPLGPTESWSPELRTAAAFVLENRFPAALVWGENLTTIYNDAFRPILGEKPEALGRSFADIWSEVWDDIGPIAQRAFAGESTFIEDFELTIHRHGGPEQAWFTFSYSPVRAADGTIVGMIDTVIETTGTVLSRRALADNEQRQAFLLKLSDALRAEPNAEAVADRALQMLFEHMGLDRCYIGIYRLAEDRADFPQQVHGDSLPPVPPQVRLSDFPEALRISFDRTLVVDDTVEMESFSESDRASFSSLGMRAVIAATLRRGENNPLWAIVAGSTCARVWTQGEVSLVEEVAERTWAAVERARAEAAMRESERRYRRVFFNNMAPMAVWRKSGEVFEANDALLELLGYTRAELEAGILRWDEITPTEYRERDMQAIAEVEANGFCTPYQKVFCHKDGRPIPIIIGGGSLDDKAGTGVLFAFDLTERQRAEQQLASREQQFETLLNQAPLGVYLVDGDFVIRQVNPIAQSVFGDIPEGPVGRDFDEVIHILWEKDYADEVVGIFRHTLETGEPYVTPERVEHRSDRDVDEYYEWRLDRIMLPDGRYGVVCYFRDISAQVRARKEIEKAHVLVRESEERFRLAIQKSKIAIYECDLDLRYTWITNPAPDFKVEDIIGRTDGELLSAKDAASLKQFKRDALASEAPVERELCGSLGGEERVFLMRAERLLDDSRRATGLRVVSLDITESKQTEAARRESEERLRLIVESARDYAIFTSDKDDVINDWMPGAEAVFGYTKEEAEGQPSAIIFTPDDRAQGEPEKEVEIALREGKAGNVGWHIRKDGQLVFIEGQIVPLRGPQGELQGFLKIGQDVTERRLAEQALHESEARFRQFGEASSDLLWIRDAETLAFEYVSPAFERLYGIPREQLLRSNDVKTWAELIHPDDREGALGLLRDLRAGVPGTYEFRVVRPDGRICWLHDTNFPMRDDSGKVVRIAGIAQDVSDRKRALELQGTLLAELQHRVRNILAMIQSVVRRTMDTSESPEEYARHLGGRIAAMARTQAMLTRSTTRRVSLDEVVRDELLSVAASEKQHWCEGPQVLLPPKAAEVFTLAIHELATNSVKYGALSTSRGQLEIRWNLVQRGEQQWMLFEWEETRVEHGGFSREGFGTELITRRVPYELRGKGAIEPTDDGMIAKLEFPLLPSNSILETYMPERLQ